MKRVLVTGANGFIGREALAPLVARGYAVEAATSSPAPPAVPGVRWHGIDLLDRGAVATLVDATRPTHLLHFAWYTVHGRFWRAPENYRWLEASLALVQCFRERGGERAVLAGTCAEYDWSYGTCSELGTPRRPALPYGACKNALFDAYTSYCASTGLSGAWGRIFFLYGAAEHPDRLLASVVRALMRGERARCTHGEQVRDFLHVEDVAAAFVALLDSPVTGPVNIASGRPTRLRDFVLEAAAQLGASDRVDFGALPAAPDDPPLLVADVRRLAQEVGFEPRYDMATGLARTIAAWRSQGGS